MHIDEQGWIVPADRVPSPNCDDRPPGTSVELLVIHAISLPPGQFGGDDIDRLFTNRLDPEAHPYFATISALRVSAHCLIRRDGTLHQYVPVGRRAWHAGVSNWGGRERCNDFSLGIELEGCDEQPFTDAQYRVLAELTRVLQQACPIADIRGHAEIAPGRKTDPGPLFDWARYRALLE